MTDTTEQKALAVFNEAMNTDATRLPDLVNRKALLRAIEQHEAFRQEVSDAVEAYRDTHGSADARLTLYSFIIAKPDPLVEAIQEADETHPGWESAGDYARSLRAAIEARGGKIVWGEK